MSILDKIADLIKKQSQLEERLSKIEGSKNISVSGETSQPKKTVDLTVYENQARELLTQAREEASRIKEESIRIKEEASRIKEEALRSKSEIFRKEAEVDHKVGAIEERERLISLQKTELEKRQKDIEELKEKQLQKLEKIANLSLDEAKKLVMEITEKRMSEEVAKKIKEAEVEIKATSEEKAKEILIDAMKHGAVDCVAEYTVSTMKLPDEEMKGRIIGKEGRNIRAIEIATGVEVELDESLDLRLSSFDPIRREVARRSIEKLMKDGRIQPQRIEEVVEKTKQEVDRIMVEEGEKLCHTAKVYNLHPDLVKMLGRINSDFHMDKI